VEPLQVGDPSYVGVYRLTGRLGAGGMGRVFLGVSPGGRTVAVKLMLPEHAADSGFRQRFAREVAAARQVGGFHTATVVDADPAADPPWMVTAYIPGPSLEEVVRSAGPLDPAALRALGAGLAEGLGAVHAAGLIHRDLKPGNVIMAEDGPRIIDFGIARAVDTPSQTSSGVLIGTFSFMSPEQVRGERLGPESDVFSLGSVLAYAATGHGPFDAAALPAIIYRIAVEPPDLGSLSGPLQGVISACLAKNPADRPPLDQLLGALSALPGQSGLSWQPPFAAAPGLSPPATTLPPPAARGAAGNPGRFPVRRAVALGGAFVAVLAIALAVIFSTPGGTGTNGGTGRQAGALGPLASSQPASRPPSTSRAPASPSASRASTSAPPASPSVAPAGSGGSTAPGPATGTTVCTTPAITCTGSDAAALQTEPAQIVNSADGARSIRGLTWSGWGTATATGAGTMEVDNCTPNCAEGHDTAYPATVTLTHPAPYGDGQQAYSVMAISVPSAPSRSNTFSTGLVP
jgi:serine/threonine protein kinase